MPNNTSIKIPLYAKAALLIICTFAVVYLLCVAKEIIMPVAYASLLAILLNPLVEFLESKKFNRVLAIAIVMIISIMVASVLLYFLSMQMARLANAFPQLIDKFNEMMQSTENWISQQFKIPIPKMEAWMLEHKNEWLNSGAGYVGQGFGTITSMFLMLLLIPVYVFMILFYRPLLMEFVLRAVSNSHREQVVEIMLQTRVIIQSYLKGLLIEGLIVAILNSVGLLALGIKYAIILGVLGAIVNVIPFIGGVSAVLLPVFVALVTKEQPLLYVALVCAIYALIQFIDNHFLIPKVVASKVKLNALVSLIVVFVGGAIWGIGGMFLSIPATAVIKIIFDHIEQLKPWGYLLGDVMPEEYEAARWQTVSHRVAARIKKATGIENNTHHKL